MAHLLQGSRTSQQHTLIYNKLCSLITAVAVIAAAALPHFVCFWQTDMNFGRFAALWLVFMSPLSLCMCVCVWLWSVCVECMLWLITVEIYLQQRNFSHCARICLPCYFLFLFRRKNGVQPLPFPAYKVNPIRTCSCAGVVTAASASA